FQNPHNPVGIFIRKRLEENTVHKAEDCGVCADPDGKRKNSNCGETGTLSQSPEAILNVLQYFAHSFPRYEYVRRKKWLGLFDRRAHYFSLPSVLISAATTAG